MFQNQQRAYKEHIRKSISAKEHKQKSISTKEHKQKSIRTKEHKQKTEEQQHLRKNFVYLKNRIVIYVEVV